MTHQPPHRRSAFTLIELLVVIAIIVTLLAILMPSMGKAVAVAERTTCQSNMHQLGAAAMSYLADHHGLFYPKRTANGVTSVFMWVGTTGSEGGGYATAGADDRYLNPYVLGQTKIEHEDEVPIARCPTDTGTNGTSFYDRVGTSYSSSHHPSYSDLTEVGDNVGSVALSRLRSPSSLITGGEHGSHSNAWSNTGFAGGIASWHDKLDHFVVLFGDGHSAFTYMPWGQLTYDGWTVHEAGR